MAKIFFVLRPNQFILIFFFIFMSTLFIKAMKLLILLFAYFFVLVIYLM